MSRPQFLPPILFQRTPMALSPSLCAHFAQSLQRRDGHQCSLPSDLTCVHGSPSTSWRPSKPLLSPSSPWSPTTSVKSPLLVSQHHKRNVSLQTSHPLLLSRASPALPVAPLHPARSGVRVTLTPPSPSRSLYPKSNWSHGWSTLSLMYA